MANKLQIKRSAVPGKVPTVADLDLGELAINTYDGKAYMKKNVSGVETVVLLTGAGAGDVLGPSSSGDNAIARFDATSGKIIQNSSATVDDDGNINALTMQASGTGANKMPVGTTAQRPATPAAGMYRMNSTTGYPEWYDASNSNWVKFPFEAFYAVDALVVGGGGGAGAGSTYIQTGVGSGGGGGGAGGFLTQSLNLIPGNSYTITVGAGGTAGTSGTHAGAGGNSRIGSFTAALGGGAGGRAGDGFAGASGGGASQGPRNGGAGTTGQGYRGGNVVNGGAPGAGGGGSSSQGVDFVGGNYGGGTAGGAGTANNYQTGSNVTYAAGGSGGQYISGSNYSGGSNGAANSGNGAVAAPGADTGGGWYNGGAGGSGIVVIRYPGPQRGSGGTITYVNGYTVHTFNSSGTYVA